MNKNFSHPKIGDLVKYTGPLGPRRRYHPNLIGVVLGPGVERSNGIVWTKVGWPFTVQRMRNDNLEIINENR